MKIKFLDNIYCKIEPAGDLQAVKSCLEYPSEYWTRGPFRMTKKVGTAFLCDQRKGTFLAGLYPRVLKYCQDNGILAETQPLLDTLKAKAPSLPGITLREDQVKLLQCVADQKRGLLVAPPGIGKTVLAGALISQYQEAVMIVHTESLFSQTVENFEKWFGKENVGVIGDQEFNPKKITVIMVQSANSLLDKKERKRPKVRKPRERKIPENETEEERDRREERWKKRDEETPEKKAKRLAREQEQNEINREQSAKERIANRAILIDVLCDADVIIVDEVHHSSGISYARILERCLAPIRIGLTATPNEKKKEELQIEGYLGPIIGQLTIQEGMEAGLLATPKVKLIPVPLNTAIGEYKSYQDLYKYGIVLNRARNRLIAKETAKRVGNGESVLIMIQDVVHEQGIMIQEMCRDLYNVEVALVQGSTESNTREEVKTALQSKKIKAVITTTIWREGINVPSLDCVIWASGGKSDIATLQGLGRGLRTTAEKKNFTIVDLLDPYKYLSQHTIQRLRIYVENGCL